MIGGKTTKTRLLISYLMYRLPWGPELDILRYYQETQKFKPLILQASALLKCVSSPLNAI